MSSNTRLRKVRARSWRERGLFLESAVLLFGLRLAVPRVALRHLVRVARLHEGAGAAAADPAGGRAAQVGWAVESAAYHLPWESTCLMQGLAGAYLLRRRRIAATLYLGVAKDGSAPDGMVAHAWLRCGDAILTGAAGRERFIAVGAYRTVDAA